MEKGLMVFKLFIAYSKYEHIEIAANNFTDFFFFQMPFTKIYFHLKPLQCCENLNSFHIVFNTATF